MLPSPQRWAEPEWKKAAPGISFKLLATDTEKNRVTMLVRLAPGTEYPPHRHAGFEELHLLYGELMIGDRKLYPGDYNRAEPAPSIIVSGARPAAHAFWLRRTTTSFFDVLIAQHRSSRGSAAASRRPRRCTFLLHLPPPPRRPGLVHAWSSAPRPSAENLEAW